MSRFLYLGFDDGASSADIILRDLATGRETVIADTRSFDFHTASFQQWILGGQAVVYDDILDGHRLCAIAPATGHGAVTRLPGMHVRAVSADMLFGYGGLREKVENNAHSAARIHFETRRIETFFTAAEAARHMPPDIAEDCPFSITHFVPNPSQTLAFFKLCKPSPTKKIPGRMEDWGGFFIFDLAARTFRCLGQRISGHPQWMPDGRHIINIMQPLDGSDNRWLVTQDALTGAISRLIDLPIEGAGHPVISPDGRWLATDAYTADHSTCPVYLIDLHTGQSAEIARFPHSTKISDRYQPHTIFRSNLHPVWSPDSRSLQVNVNHSGDRLGIVFLDDFLAV